MKNDIFFIILFLCVFLSLGFFCFITQTKIEHEKTIQKALECGYEPLCIGGDYWNKGD